MSEAGRAFPVALDRDVIAGSLVRARLGATALLLWRADDGVVRVWEDVCPHRSVRLSAGRNLGTHVEGAYHGWRFGKDGTVLGIPAEGGAARPDIRVNVVSALVHADLVWACLAGDCPAPGHRPRTGEVPIRPLPFAVPAGEVEAGLEAFDGMRLVATPTGPASAFLFGHAASRAGESAADLLRRCNERLVSYRRALEKGRAA